MAEFPLAPRVWAGIAALAVTVYFGILTPTALLQDGYHWSAALMIVVAVPLVAFLTFLALAPRALQTLLARATRIDLRDGGHAGVTIVMALTLFFVLGYGSLVNGLYAFEHQELLGRESPPVSGDGLFAGILMNAVVLVLPVLLFVSFVGGTGPRGALRAVGIHGERAPLALALGVGTAIGAILLLAVVSAAVLAGGVEVPENELALEIASSITLLGALGLATGAAVSEEIFFRGFLQPRVGLWGQAILFGLAHLSYVNVLQVVVTFALGLGFGLLYRRTGSLLAPIAAHFAFNFIMLLVGIYGA